MKQNILNNVAIIRPLLILLLVFYHAFAPYSGGWEPIEGYPEIPIYWWLDKFSYFIMLELFVLLSGYVFGFQVRTKGESKLEFCSLSLSKFKRLMVPSMVFSLLYIILFRNPTCMSILSLINGIVSGTGHMWFLPMLFCCFLAVWLNERIRISPKLVLPILFICSVLPIPVLPLHLGHSIHYLFYFYLGYCIQKYNFRIDKIFKSQYVVIMSGVFLLLFIAVTLLHESNNFQMGGAIFKGFWSLLTTISKTIGVVFALSIVGIIEKKKSIELSVWVIKTGELCMGVYLCQQFILLGIYKYTTAPVLFGPYYLPWIGFTIALVGSLTITYILRKFKFGRLLIG